MGIRALDVGQIRHAPVDVVAFAESTAISATERA